MAALRIVALDKIRQIRFLKGIGLEGEVLVRAQVVDPQLLRPGDLPGGPAVEEEHIGFHSLGIEDARRQTQQGVHVAALQQIAPHRLPRPALEEDIVRHHNGCSAVGLEHGSHVLEEVELLVGGGGSEVLAAVGLRLAALLGPAVGDGDAALLAEGGIGKDDVHLIALFLKQGVGHLYGAFLAADAVQVEIHGAQPGHAVHDVRAPEGVRFEG